MPKSTQPPNPSENCFHVWELTSNIRNRIGYRCARCAEFTEVDDLEAFQRSLEPEISEAELFAFIADIEQGRIELYPTRAPSQVYEGRVKYRASNGWSVVVFNDCDSWDYFDRFESEDGRVVTMTTMPAAIQAYRPDQSIATRRYNFAMPASRQKAYAVWIPVLLPLLT